MIAAWMLYSLLCALGLFAAAAFAERALLRGNAPVRLVWIAAIALTLLVPVAAFRLASSTPPAASPAAGVQQLVSSNVTENNASAFTQPPAPTLESAPERLSRFTLARLDGPLAIAWLVLSLAFALKFLGGISALAWMRRRWLRDTVQGVPVFMSERTGPAVVGVVAPLIVLPRWVLALDAAQLSLLLRHEQEHRRAGDGQLLTLAELALIAMPWNIALWWQVLRLRVAVELDCDARVLRSADARSYGALLLEVARPGRAQHLVGATAFAERAVQLDRRIRMLPRYRTRTSRAARILAPALGIVVVSVAWVAPHPAVPQRTIVSASKLPVLTPPIPRAMTELEPRTATAKATEARRVSPTVQPVANRSKQAAEAVLSTPTVKPPSAPCDLSRSPDIALAVEAVYDLLFDGITLTREQEAKACEQLAGLQRLQLAQDQAIAQANAAAQARRVQRNTALRGLLTNDADRARFDELATRPQPFARGVADSARYSLSYFGRGGADTARMSGVARSGGGGRGGRVIRTDTVARAVVGRGGGRGARVGGAGAGAVVDTAAGERRAVLRERVGTLYGAVGFTAGSAPEMIADITMRQLFNGITLTPEQQSAARTIISTTEQEIIDARPPALVHIRLNASGVVTMQPESKDALLAIVTNEADRAKLDARIVIVMRRG